MIQFTRFPAEHSLGSPQPGLGDTAPLSLKSQPGLLLPGLVGLGCAAPQDLSWSSLACQAQHLLPGVTGAALCPLEPGTPPQVQRRKAALKISKAKITFHCASIL